MSLHEHISIFTDGAAVCEQVMQLCIADRGKHKIGASCAPEAADPAKTPEERACAHINASGACAGAAFYTCVRLAPAIAGDFSYVVHRPLCRTQCVACSALAHTTRSMARTVVAAAHRHLESSACDRAELVLVPVSRRILNDRVTVQIVLAAVLVSIHGLEVAPAPPPAPFRTAAALAVLLMVILMAGFFAVREGAAERTARALEADEYATAFVLAVCGALFIAYIGFLAWRRRARLCADCAGAENDVDAEASLFVGDLPQTPARQTPPEQE